ncbi:hypothetical protein [Pedobacter sp. KLB.chiD]|uniref:hypothetical protein n=1 Tax=Pedobacter sp. KLB.chiD TaxID=3387402 RepID=UPI00399A6590
MLSNSSTLKQTVFTFFFIFLILGITSCEKHLQDYDLPTLDESADQFTKDLNDVLMTSNKTTHLLDALNRGDHLDWSKIVLRISSDLNANINYCIPIVKPGGICDDFVEISLSGPKTASNITIKKYDSSITVNKSNRMEIERIKKVLYRFAQMGLKVSPQLVEQQRIVIQEFDKKKTCFITRCT